MTNSEFCERHWTKLSLIGSENVSPGDSSRTTKIERMEHLEGTIFPASFFSCCLAAKL
jgi:hypothetical protein